jgi:hypothetical protein
MKILIKFPSRGRPEKFKKVLLLYYENLEKKKDTKFVFTFDNDDNSMKSNEIKNFIKDLDLEYEIFYGESKNKIEAINANLENKIFDILILAADDMIPVVKNYDTEIIKHFENSTYKLDCILHTHSVRWSDKLDINCILGWDYYKRFNYIYHPSYKSIFADNEYTEVSKLLKRNVFTPNFCPFYHDWKGGDETEIKNFQFNHEDWLVYEERKKNNYDLNL